eukprot:Skav201879  [mRNA]  locus=scaffold550:168909:170976:+ [translate_table: standard]
MRLKEIERHEGRGQRPPARKAEEVDRRHGKGIRIAEHAAVVVHLRRRHQQLPGAAEAEQRFRMIHWDQCVTGAVDEENRAGDVRHPPLVLEDVAEEERHEATGCRADGDEGRD